MKQDEDEAFKARLQDYKIELRSVYEKGQDAFEKQLSYLSAGALGLSFLFIEKVVINIHSSKCKFALAISWILLASTLLVNLVSHFISKRNIYKTISEIDNDKYDSKIAEKRNKQVERLNIFTIISFFLGILLLIIFVFTNTMSDDIKTPNGPDLQKGLTSTPAPRPQTGQIPTPPPSNIPQQPVNTPPKSK